MPIISEQPNDMNINVYEPISFKCTAHCFKIIKVVWKRVKHNMPITTEVTEIKSLNEISSILKITNSIGHYSGQYYCVVESELGKTVSQIANLIVQGNINELYIMHYDCILM